MSVKRVQAIVSGHVQGVGYRYFAVHVASRLGITGTVRNVPTGVEAVAEGEESVLKDFVAELQRGPTSAQVSEITQAWSDAPSRSFDQFTAIS